MVKLNDDDFRRIEYIQLEINRMYDHYGICGFSGWDKKIQITEEVFMFNFKDYDVERFDSTSDRYSVMRDGFKYFALVDNTERTIWEL